VCQIVDPNGTVDTRTSRVDAAVENTKTMIARVIMLGLEYLLPDG
jgi:hypothetical protein